MNPRTLHLGVALLSLLLSVAQRAGAQAAIMIPNSSFETPVVNDFAQFPGTDWQMNSAAGVFYFPWVASGYSSPSAPHGTQIGYIDFGSIYQVLTTEYLAGQTYSLSLMIGKAFDTPLASGSIDFMRGNTIVASSGLVSPVVAGTFQQVTVLYVAQAGDHGQPIRIQINRGPTNERLTFDNVQLTTVPEPATYAALVGGVALALAGLRRRRSKPRYSGMAS